MILEDVLQLEPLFFTKISGDMISVLLKFYVSFLSP